MKQEIISKTSGQAIPAFLRWVLPVLGIMFLAACSPRPIAYQGNCGQQTQQFMDYVYSFVIDELNPVIEEGFASGPTADVMAQLDKIDARVGEINIPECNPRAQAVKDALRNYMMETETYFTTVAGRAVYGEGSVQGQRSEMVEAGFALEVALEDLRK